ncbi:hypothetical protein HAPS_0493 [Glaesserella parasuis SH0165]|uniref:Uncharacterized protein n=1 Tax=Glaesserella parasuis serovar 5 (strain SH0165) TaxID=557723 RepID=B8F4A6_GLAP5|nr:hypothetical protein HAPS_0493 [Glaesserella parasuis SH0165]
MSGFCYLEVKFVYKFSTIFDKSKKVVENQGDRRFPKSSSTNISRAICRVLLI